MKISLNFFNTPFIWFAVLLLNLSAIEASYSVPSTQEEQIETVLSLMSNVGKIVRKSERDLTPELQRVTIETTNGSIHMEFSRESSRLQLISRSTRNSIDNKLKWSQEEVAKKSAYYIERLFGRKNLGLPLLVRQENVTGERNLWSVSWPRTIRGYKVKNDFVTITFNESEGLFGFAYSWSSPTPQSLPIKPLKKTEAEKLAKLAALQIMQKFKNLFSGYLLGKIVLEDLIIVAPNNVLSDKVKSEADLLKEDVKNPRPAWMITFRVEIDPNSNQSTFSDASGLSVWIDAETGKCIGAEF